MTGRLICCQANDLESNLLNLWLAIGNWSTNQVVAADLNIAAVDLFEIVH